MFAGGGVFLAWVVVLCAAAGALVVVFWCWWCSRPATVETHFLRAARSSTRRSPIEGSAVGRHGGCCEHQSPASHIPSVAVVQKALFQPGGGHARCVRCNGVSVQGARDEAPRADGKRVLALRKFLLHSQIVYKNAKITTRQGISLHDITNEVRVSKRELRGDLFRKARV